MSPVDVEQMYAAESPVCLKEWHPSVDFHADQGCTQQRPDVNADVFLGKAASLPGGASAAQAKAYWSKLAFTGKGTPPPEAGNSAAVKKAVAGAPGGIGYIEKSAADATVKVVLTVN